MKIKCSAVTCKFNYKGFCKSDGIELIDFEYYEDLQGKEKNYSIDDMKCITYRSIYKED